MRQWHRWTSVVFGAFMLFIAITGLMLQAIDLTKAPAPRPAPLACTPGGFAPPRPKTWSGIIKHLHSGETFGPVGIAVSIASGVALTFFAVSGLWMYVQMFRRQRAGVAKVFW